MSQFRMTVMAILLAAAAQAQGLRENINATDQSVSLANQTLTGTWLIELQRPGAPSTIPLCVVFLPGGAVVGISSSDGVQSGQVGVWTRVGDRKFLQTMYGFGFNENLAFATVNKIRINVLLSEDGSTLTGTTEVVVMDREGKVLNTIPGTTYTGTRLAAEKPGDFDEFQARE